MRLLLLMPRGLCFEWVTIRSRCSYLDSITGTMLGNPGYVLRSLLQGCLSVFDFWTSYSSRNFKYSLTRLPLYLAATLSWFFGYKISLPPTYDITNNLHPLVLSTAQLAQLGQLTILDNGRYIAIYSGFVACHRFPLPI